ncbi:MAG: PPE domain-containing protein [Candidatus Obscuribacterales bacterium]|nr:PPE domain-containing protein [Candidatus Obscuribacterales bacterium]
MTENTGKKRRLRKTIAKLKTLNSTQGMKTPLGGNFSVLPPEINSARIFNGAGAGPMQSAAAAWDGLASELGSAADSFSSTVSQLTADHWKGDKG